MSDPAAADAQTQIGVVNPVRATDSPWLGGVCGQGGLGRRTVCPSCCAGHGAVLDGLGLALDGRGVVLDGRGVVLDGRGVALDGAASPASGSAAPSPANRSAMSSYDSSLG